MTQVFTGMKDEYGQWCFPEVSKMMIETEYTVCSTYINTLFASIRWLVVITFP